MSDVPSALARKPASGSPSAKRPDAGYAPGADTAPRAGTGLGILVGYDGSADSERALIWAAREARVRKTALTVCQAWGPGFPVLPDEEAVRKSARRRGERVISEGLRFARSLMGPTDVRPMLVPGSAAAALCEHSSEADIVVTGAKGQGGMAGTSLGSVSEHVAAYAHGSIVVVRGHWRPAAGLSRGAVVVGLTDRVAAGPQSILRSRKLRSGRCRWWPYAHWPTPQGASVALASARMTSKPRLARPKRSARR
jgi:nucleotide-binding universal stress UspA family protein